MRKNLRPMDTNSESGMRVVAGGSCIRDALVQSRNFEPLMNANLR